MYFPHFYPDKFYNGQSNWGKSVRSASYLTTQPRPFSPLQWSNLGIFQPSPRDSLIFFSIEPPYPVLFHLGCNSPGSFQPARYPVSFAWVGLSLYLSTESHSLSRPWVGMPWMFHPVPPPPPASIFPTRRGLGNLLHSQIKLRISTNTGDSRLTQICLHSLRRQMGARDHCWSQSSGSSWSPVKGRKSALGPFVVAKTINLKKRCTTWELSFIWGKMRTAA